MKRAFIPAIVAVGLAVFMVFQLMAESKARCKVCVSFKGRQQCATAAGEDEKTALREAQSSACSLIAHGVSDAFACPNVTPDEETCE